MRTSLFTKKFLEKINCKLCHSTRSLTLLSDREWINQVEGTLTIVKRENCGFV